jgi:hypothetical protein
MKVVIRLCDGQEMIRDSWARTDVGILKVYNFRQPTIETKIYMDDTRGKNPKYIIKEVLGD